MKKEDIQKHLLKHQLWLNGEQDGKMAALRGADLRRTDLSNANLRYADLRGADLIGADLSNANLRWADLRWADLCSADLRRANLRWANLCRANLKFANLSSADLIGADLSSADFSGADLRGADLRWADLSESRGVRHVSCSWNNHGECGRTLTAILIDNEMKFFCGCFSGTQKDLEKYIDCGEERYRVSRTTAMRFCLDRMAEMM